MGCYSGFIHVIFLLFIKIVSCYLFENDRLLVMVRIVDGAFRFEKAVIIPQWGKFRKFDISTLLLNMQI